MNDNVSNFRSPAAERELRVRHVLLEVQQRRNQGESVPDESVVIQHADLMPELGEDLRLLHVLDSDDTPCESRDNHGGNQPLGPATGRLTVRCPNCGQPVEMKADTTFANISCGTCGCRFSLAGEADDTRAERTLTNLGKFELLERLGMGAFGSVWKARDTDLNRIVAVKIPRERQLGTNDNVDQFLREARAAAQLNHPNIVGVHEVGRADDTVFIVCDLVRGASLSDWLSRRRPTFREAAELSAKIADALHHAHEAGVIHRDLKPQNIMLSDEREPHLTDFGLARWDAGEVTMTPDGAILGTPAYMSPEQARGEAHSADCRSDVYSLGVILFQLLTGELPFRGNTRILIHQILNDEAPSPRTLNSAVPRDLETICIKCLEKAPVKRHQTANELASELRRYLAGRPIQSRRISIPTRIGRWCRRYPLAASLFLLLAVLAVVGPLVAINQRGLYREQARLYRDADAASEEQRRLLCITDTHLAMEAWEDANLGRVQALLSRHRPPPGKTDYRGFVWHYLWRQLHHGLNAPRIKTGSPVNSLAVSPDGRLLAVGGGDGLIRLYDADSLQPSETLELKGHAAPLRSLAFSPEGELLASVSWDSVRVWNTDTLQEALPSKHHEEGAWCATFSPNGELLAVGTNAGTILLWDVSLNRLRDGWDASLARHTGDVRSVAFSPSGRQLASCSPVDSVKLWELDAGELTWQHDVAAGTLALVADESLAIDCGNTIQLLDANTGGLHGQLVGHRALPLSLAFSADSGWLASCGMDNTVRLWNIDSSSWLKKTYRGHMSSVHVVAFSADQTRLFSGGLDGNIMVWNVAPQQEQDTLYHSGGVLSVDFAPDGATLVTSCEDGRINIWDTDTGMHIPPALEGHSQAVTCARFFSDGKATFLASCGDDSVRIWDSMSRRTIHVYGDYDAGKGILAVADEASVLAWPQRNRTLRVWNLGRLSDVPGLSDVSGLALSPDGRLLAAALWDGGVHLWDVTRATYRTKLSEQTSVVKCLRFSPDGRVLVTGGEDLTLRLWELQPDEDTPILLHTLSGHGGSVVCAAFSPDGSTLASGATDRTIRLWDVATGEQQGILKGHDNAVSDLEFAPDGNILASASWDETVRLWRATTDQHISDSMPANIR